MPTDRQILALRQGKYKNLSNAEAAKCIAFELGMNPDGVRGRLSRTSNPIEQRVANTQAIAYNVALVPPSVERQLKVIAYSKAKFELDQYAHERTGIFFSDGHFPKARYDVYNVALQLMAYIQPDEITALNDMLDNEGFGKHEANKLVYKSIWRGDDAYGRKLQSQIHSDLRSVMKRDGRLLGLWGNHCVWPLEFWRTNTPQSAEATIADYMESLCYDDGVLLFTRGETEGEIELGLGLVLVHGKAVAKNQYSNAKNVLSYYMRDGRARTVIQGHTHRPIEIDGVEVGYRGVKYVNNGHLRNDNPEWLKFPANDWGFGITRYSYNPMTWQHDAELIRIYEKKDMVVARYDGQEFTAKIDKSMPLHIGN